MSPKQRKISIAEMAPHVHSFSAGENKVDKISNWLINWLEDNLRKGNIHENDFLPTKADIAFHLGVSLGTIQNVYRAVEDSGFIESKQKIGSFIKNINNAKTKKLTSKRELACECIKSQILKNKLKIGDNLPSTRELAEITGFSASTLRNAMNKLSLINIIEKKGKNFRIKNKTFEIKNLKNETLVNKISKDLSLLLKNNYNIGDKIPSNKELAQLFGVSIKTIHDSIKSLSKNGIISTRRGKYGTIYINEDNNAELIYFYETIIRKIKKYIIENCEIGAKLPSIKELSYTYNVSPKTVKKALDILKEDGYIMFLRGRHGGSFVTDIPQGVNEAYTWLALNPHFKEDNN